MTRVSVVGTTGSGKSTLAETLATAWGIAYIELDALHWLPGWQAVETDEFRRRVTEATAGDGWVVAGNYSKVRDIVWSRADTVIWLDYPLPLIMWRLAKRSAQRARTKENLWGTGNVETWRAQFFSRDSLFIWALKTYRRNKRRYSAAMTDPQNAHLRFFRLRSVRETNRWLMTHTAGPGSTSTLATGPHS
jgi:adenylate kinase family enzyme